MQTVQCDKTLHVIRKSRRDDLMTSLSLIIYKASKLFRFNIQHTKKKKENVKENVINLNQINTLDYCYKFNKDKRNQRKGMRKKNTNVCFIIRFFLFFSY